MYHTFAQFKEFCTKYKLAIEIPYKYKFSIFELLKTKLNNDADEFGSRMTEIDNYLQRELRTRSFYIIVKNFAK